MLKPFKITFMLPKFITFLFCLSLFSLGLANAAPPANNVNGKSKGNSASDSSNNGSSGNNSKGKMILIPVGEATVDRSKLVVYPLYTGTDKNQEGPKLLKTIKDLIPNDFSFYQKRFLVADYKSYSGKLFSDGSLLGVDMSSPLYEQWRQNKVDYLITIKAPGLGSSPSVDMSPVKIIIEAFDIKKGSAFYKNEITVNNDNVRAEGHHVSADIYKQITGKKSIFNSRIMFVSDKNSDWSKGTIIKETYMMDFDGYNVTRITNQNGIVVSPSPSKDGDKILYSLIRSEKGRKTNVDLYLLNMKNKESELISSLEGINSGAVFSPDGETVALTLSKNGNSNIYALNIKNKNLRKITDHFGENVDPAYSPDGKTMAFISGRPGRPMIYLLDPSGGEKDVRRLSFVGEIQATPRFSPNGQEIVFCSWVDHGFDIYRIDTSGQELFRLTKNFGSNEEPYYSPDGEFIVFSSQKVISRTMSVKNLYLMTRDGDIIGAITDSFGNCTTPRWID